MRALHYRRYVRKERVFTSEEQRAAGEQAINHNQLKIECLRGLYRLLFIFYIEARPELGYAPLTADVYREGYSLESLRDLEQSELHNAEDEGGTTLIVVFASCLSCYGKGIRCGNRRS